MRYIKDIKDGDQLNGIYYCKEKKELRSKNDKPYYSLILQDKTGSLDGKVWDTNSNGIEDFAGGDHFSQDKVYFLSPFKSGRCGIPSRQHL